MAARILLLPVLLVPALWAGLWGCTITLREHVLQESLPPPRSSSNQWLGAGSCASAGCHNANGFQGDIGSEYTTWISHDPHARAFEVLYNDRSTRIVENLFPQSGKKAKDLALCLNCHVHKEYETANHGARFAKHDGVGCESCHGPAGDWVSEHYKPEWRGLSDGQKLAKGMWDTRSLAGRVQNCTPCHVGAAGMDVNHDLIAAGHPRLAFEFAAFHANMPHHWPDEKDKVSGKSSRARPDWDAAVWLVGQALTAKAAVELTAARANTNIWPEFAEYDCYACHHQLEAKSWRQDRAGMLLSRDSLGLPWNDWYAGTLAYQIAQTDIPANAVIQEIDRLKALMQSRAKGKPVSPDPELVRRQADLTAQALQSWAKQAFDKTHSRESFQAVLGRLIDRGANQKPSSWDDAAQSYLAIAAVCFAIQDAKQPETLGRVKDGLKHVRKLLQFVPPHDGPSPDFTPDQVLNVYRALRMEAKQER